MNDEIFLSYASEDRARVEPLARFLEAAGWSVWWDRAIPIRRTFDEVIEEALDAAQCVIVVWTEASVASRWVKTEAEEGLHRQILAPVMMDEVRIPLAFRRIQTADLVGWEGEGEHPGIARLIAAVTHFAGPPREESSGRDEEDAVVPPIALAPEPEGATEAIYDEIAPEEVEPEVEPVATEQAETGSIDDEPRVAEESKTDAASEAEEPAVVEGPEAGEAEEFGVEAVEEAVREDLEQQPETLPEEKADTPEKTVPAGLERWIKEPKRLVLVAGGVVIALVIAFAIQMGGSPPQPVLPVGPFASIPGQSWFMGTYEVTQGQWRAVMGTEPWKGKQYVQEGDNYPAVYVSWDDAKAFIAKLNELDSSYQYRLPTEEEWEYACRAGSTTEYSFGDDEAELGKYAWYDENTVDEKFAHRVGRKKENVWGLYDMHGNVWEWTETESGSYRVIRGGGFGNTARFARSAYRSDLPPVDRDDYLGFRLVRTGL